MWIKLWNVFVKITAWLVQWFCFRTKIYYEDRSVQGRHIKGRAIIVSNHTSVYDYAVWLFVFITRTLRVQMAEVLFEHRLLKTFLKCMGGIRVDRNTNDMSFIVKSESILREGGVVGVFPEGRLPRKGEARPLPFVSSVSYLALNTDTPVIPVYTDGSYFNKRRARVIIGKPVDLKGYINPEKSEKENLAYATEKLRERIIELGNELNERSKKG